MYTVRIFMKCTHVCAAQTTYLFLTLFIYLFLLSDEIAETRPDMKNKVAAFTVSEKSINTGKLLVSSSLMSYKEYYGSPGGTFIANDL